MRPIVYALIGIILYAIQNTIIDVRLSKYSTVNLLVGWYMVLLPLAVGLYVYQKYFGVQTAFPAGADFKLLSAVAVMFFIADFFYIAAFTTGGNAVTITILLVLMPVVASVMKFVWVKDIPTRYHFAAFILAFGAVALVAIGNSKKTVKPRPAHVVTTE